MDKGKRLSYIDSYKKFKASRICVQWCIIIGLSPFKTTALPNLYSTDSLEHGEHIGA